MNSRYTLDVLVRHRDTKALIVSVEIQGFWTHDKYKLSDGIVEKRLARFIEKPYLENGDAVRFIDTGDAPPYELYDVAMFNAWTAANNIDTGGLVMLLKAFDEKLERTTVDEDQTLVLQVTEGFYDQVPLEVLVVLSDQRYRVATAIKTLKEPLAVAAGLLRKGALDLNAPVNLDGR